MAFQVDDNDAQIPQGKGKLFVLIQEVANKYQLPFDDVVMAANEVMEMHSRRINGGVYRVA